MTDAVQTCDVLVVGLGALGSAASYWAAERGLRVVGLERFELGHARGASEDHSRIIRRTYPTTDYVRFAQGAFDAWAAVEEESGERLVLRTGGLDLFPAESADDLDAYVAAMEAEGVVHEVLDAAEVTARWPQWRLPVNLRALFQPDAGIVAASLANATHRRLALSHGATLLGETPVRSIRPDGEGYAVETDGGTFRAGALVVTADAWTDEALAPFGVSFRLRVQQEQVTYHDAADAAAFDPSVFPVWIWHTDPHVYGLPNFGLPGPKVALHGAGPKTTADTRTFEPDPRYAAEVAAFVAEHLPSAAGPPLEVKTCLYTLTPDRHFVLDRVPGQQAAVVGLGTAHAFKFASVFGKALVELAVDGSSAWAFPRFSATRGGLGI
ncbi:MAG: N-methyl-L-tryptophan oxidase [Planctomycetaceae bacterium]